jgi:hypothetical protein
VEEWTTILELSGFALHYGVDRNGFAAAPRLKQQKIRASLALPSARARR